MNTHDIKLPPLPYPQIPGNGYTARDMQAYARSAIEADRQARQCECQRKAKAVIESEREL